MILLPCITTISLLCDRFNHDLVRFTRRGGQKDDVPDDDDEEEEEEEDYDGSVYEDEVVDEVEEEAEDEAVDEEVEDEVAETVAEGEKEKVSSSAKKVAFNEENVESSSAVEAMHEQEAGEDEDEEVQPAVHKLSRSRSLLGS